MKKTLSINIAGLVFNIDEDAYEMLKQYLHSIEMRYINEPGKEEILLDIESRISEELNKMRNSQKESIVQADVETIINQLGRVEDFDTTDAETKKEETSASSSKRLYRNPDDAMIAGVASGLGIYFGIDTVIIRVLFIAFVFAGGFAIPVYLILWLIAPKAVTPAQKASMKGEPLTLQKIVSEVKESVQTGRKRFGI